MLNFSRTAHSLFFTFIMYSFECRYNGNRALELYRERLSNRRFFFGSNERQCAQRLRKPGKLAPTLKGLGSNKKTLIWKKK